jgi:hypothetical protein
MAGGRQGRAEPQIHAAGNPAAAGSSRTRTRTPCSPAISMDAADLAATPLPTDQNRERSGAIIGAARWDSRAVKGDGL